MSGKHIFLEEPLFEVVDCLFFIMMSDGGVGIEACYDEITIISFCSHRYIIWDIYIYIVLFNRMITDDSTD